MRYQVQELGVGGILDHAISLVKNNFGLLLGITCVLFVPLQLIVGFMIISNMPELPANATWFVMFMARVEAAQDPLIQILNFAAILLALPITNAAMVYAVANEYIEKPVSVGRSFARAFQIILPLIGTWILMFLAVFVGMIFSVSSAIEPHEHGRVRFDRRQQLAKLAACVLPQCRVLSKHQRHTVDTPQGGSKVVVPEQSDRSPIGGRSGET